jgi:hypothetical protein
MVKLMKISRLRKSKHLNKQIGGVTSLIAMIGTTLGIVSNYIAIGFLAILNEFKMWPQDEYLGDAAVGYEYSFLWPGNWEYGLFWKYIGFCIKSSLYLVIFVFGGPIVTLIGMIYLYFNIFNTNIKNEDEEKSENTSSE